MAMVGYFTYINKKKEQTNYNFGGFPTVYSWGEGEEGKLGHSDRLTYDKPKLIEALSGVTVIDIACGSAHSACITSSGNLYTWGKGR